MMAVPLDVRLASGISYALILYTLPVFVKNGAIIPMWEENNTPEQIKKENRIVEFWPDGKNILHDV